MPRGRRCAFPLKCARPNYQNDSGPFNGNGGSTKSPAAALLSLQIDGNGCHIPWYGIYRLCVCIRHLYHAICPHGPLRMRAGCDTVLPHGMLFLCICAFHTPTSKGVVTLRTLIQGYNRTHAQRPTAQAHAIKGPKGPQKSVLGLGCHGKL